MAMYDIIELNPVWSRIIPNSKFFKTLREELSYTKVIWSNKKKEFRKFSCVSPYGFFGSGFLEVIEERWPEITIKRNQNMTKLGMISISCKLRDYQINAISTSLKKKRGIIYAPTGSGKTVIAAALISSISSCIFIVHTRALLEQQRKNLKNLLGEEIGILGSGEREINKIMVCTIQSLSNLEKRELKKFEHYQMLLVDEAHHAHSDSYQKILRIIKAPYRFGLTATPHQLWTKEEYMKTTAFIGPIIYKVRYQELEKKGFLACPIVYIFTINHPRLNSNWSEIYKRSIVENKKRNKLIAQLAKRISVRRSVLIQVALIEHGENIVKFLPDAFLVKGETPKEVQNQIKEALKRKDIRIVISTTVWKEGVDIPSLDCVINAVGKKSRISTIQSVGRALRPKEKAYIIDFLDLNQKYLEDHSKERLKIYKSLGWEVKIVGHIN